MQRPRPFLTAAPSRMIRFRSIIRLLAPCLFAMFLIGGCGRSQEHDDSADRQADLSDESTIQMRGLAAADELGPPHLLAFVCGADAHYLAILDPTDETVALHTFDGVRLLTHTPAASGAKYEDRRFMLWTRGSDMVMLEIDGQTVDDCRPSGRQQILTATYQAGYHLRAGGNEPGWTLLVGPQTIRLDLLNRPGALFPGLEAGGIDDEGALVRHSEQHALRIVIEDQPCLDTMSGEPAPLTVTVDLDGEVLRGCGVPLVPIDHE